jgi:hypothetical protein
MTSGEKVAVVVVITAGVGFVIYEIVQGVGMAEQAITSPFTALSSAGNTISNFFGSLFGSSSGSNDNSGNTYDPEIGQ